MPRRNRPKPRTKRRPPDEDNPEKELRAPDLVGVAPPGWEVRLIQPASAVKEYRCPGCNQEIRAGTKHVVVWREGAEEMRRHWHLPCWGRSAKR